MYTTLCIHSYLTQLSFMHFYDILVAVHTHTHTHARTHTHTRTHAHTHTHTHTHIATEWSTDIPETQLLPTRGAFPSWPPLSPLCPLQEQDLIRRRRAGGRGQLSQEHSRLQPRAQQVGSIMCILYCAIAGAVLMSLMKHKYGV